MRQRLLLPLDGSKVAEQALGYGSSLGRLADSELYLLRICSDSNEAQQVGWPYVADTANQLRVSLGSLAANLHQCVAVGEVGQEIQRYAVENDIDTIIITAQGQSGSPEHPIGKTARILVDTASIPVLLVAPQADACPRVKNLFKQMLLPLDGTSSSEAAIPALASFARSVRANLLLLRVGTEHQGAVEGTTPTPSLGFDNKKVQARSYLYDMATRFYGSKAKIEIDTELGDLVEVTARRADQIGANLIAFTPSFSGILDHWFGNTSARTGERQSPLSFLIVPIP